MFQNVYDNHLALRQCKFRQIFFSYLSLLSIYGSIHIEGYNVRLADWLKGILHLRFDLPKLCVSQKQLYFARKSARKWYMKIFKTVFI